jgi:NAD(P)-dependent dehydrogenase (short-subunit alcohol dehydrogenase family)
MGQMLAGRCAVIVGAGPGLGSAIAMALGQAGASLVLVARTASVLDTIATKLQADGVAVETIVADIDDAADRRQVRDVVEQAHGKLDILVLNAARHGEQKTFAESNLADWQATMNTNLFAGLGLIQQLLPLLRKGTGSNIVFIGAMAMRMVSSAGRAGYAISKAAIGQAVRSLAFELGRENIRVNAVVPGWMDSAHVQSWREDPALSHHVDRALASIPLGRIPMPEDVAGSVLYLASDLAAVVTGASIDANGGHYMGP